MKPINFHLEAEKEMNFAAKKYNDKMWGLGLDFLDEIDRALNVIQCSPERWVVIAENIRKYILHRFPYKIIYENINHSIYILAVGHHKQKPEYWKDRIT